MMATHRVLNTMTRTPACFKSVLIFTCSIIACEEGEGVRAMAREDEGVW